MPDIPLRTRKVDYGMVIAPTSCDMDIRFISSLTAEDENAFAPALLRAVSAVLDQFPIAYTLRIETTGSQVFQHNQPAFEVAAPMRSVLTASAHDDRVHVDRAL